MNGIHIWKPSILQDGLEGRGCLKLRLAKLCFNTFVSHRGTSSEVIGPRELAASFVTGPGDLGREYMREERSEGTCEF